MHNDKKDKKTPLGNLDETLDRMLYGAGTIREARLEEALKRRRLKKGNRAK